MTDKKHPNVRRYVLSDLIDEWTAEPLAIFEFGGEEFMIPAVVSWPDRIPRQVDAQAKLLLGDRYDRYVELGGTGRHFDKLLQLATRDTQGVTAGE